jgi:hypothetical protein
MDGFTLAVCQGQGCAAGPEHGPLERALSDTTRTCPHGVMVVTGCLMGPLLCRSCGPSATPDAGRLAVIQPCHASRAPSGPAVLAGPIRDDADASDLCAWLRAGALTADRLPGRLLGYGRVLHSAPQN